jgi:hypothetical protein
MLQGAQSSFSLRSRVVCAGEVGKVAAEGCHSPYSCRLRLAKLVMDRFRPVRSHLVRSQAYAKSDRAPERKADVWQRAARFDRDHL